VVLEEDRHVVAASQAGPPEQVRDLIRPLVELAVGGHLARRVVDLRRVVGPAPGPRARVEQLGHESS
jgi:hypothetical protein